MLACLSTVARALHAAAIVTIAFLVGAFNSFVGFGEIMRGFAIGCRSFWRLQVLRVLKEAQTIAGDTLSRAEPGGCLRANERPMSFRESMLVSTLPFTLMPRHVDVNSFRKGTKADRPSSGIWGNRFAARRFKNCPGVAHSSPRRIPPAGTPVAFSSFCSIGVHPPGKDRESLIQRGPVSLGLVRDDRKHVQPCKRVPDRFEPQGAAEDWRAWLARNELELRRLRRWRSTFRGYRATGIS